jgi:hypothetical protein
MWKADFDADVPWTRRRRDVNQPQVPFDDRRERLVGHGLDAVDTNRLPLRGVNALRQEMTIKQPLAERAMTCFLGRQL